MQTTGQPRILILSASVGAGHVRAAEALEPPLRRLLPDADIVHIDVLTLTNAAFRRFYASGYFYMVKRAPRLVGHIYDMLDHPADDRRRDLARQAFQRLNFTRLKRLLIDQHWDLVINTHFLAPELIANLRRKGKVNFPQAIVVTDFDVHGMWINQPCERYFVATEEARKNIAAAGIPMENVEVTGIPIDAQFSSTVNTADIRARHGLSPDRPVILQLAGGFGVGSIEQIYRSICQIPVPLQVVVVCGNNAAARDMLETIGPCGPHNVKIIGYTREMHDFMAAASIVVSKPGGLTTAECLARGAPMVVVEPIPGQEDRNSDYLLENGCAIKVNNLASLTHKINSLLNDPARLSRMRQQVAQCAHPRAAFDVAAGCVEILSNPSAASLSLPAAGQSP